MNKSASWRRLRAILLGLLLAVVLAACSGGGAPAPSPTPQPVAPATAAPLPTDTPLPLPLPTVAAEAQPTPPDVPDSPEAAAIDALLAGLYDGAPWRGAVLVARQGEVIFRRGYGLADAAAGLANTPETRFRLGSVTKPITALAVLKLQAAGLVDVAQPVCAYVADCPPAWSAITVHHLLSHTSGIPDFTRFPDFAATRDQPTTPAQTLARFADDPLEFVPGARWEYSNSNYIVLGALIEQVSGQAYAAFVQDAIFAPLGMQDSGYDTLDGTLAQGYLPDGRAAASIHMSIPFAAGGLYSTVEDLYTLDRALVAGDFLPDDLRAQMWTAHAAIPGPGPAQGYGYGWIVIEGAEGPEGKVVGHNGSIEGFSAGLRHYLEPDLLIVALSNEEQRNPNLVMDGIARLLLPQ